MEYREHSKTPHEGAIEFTSLDMHKGAGESPVSGNQEAVPETTRKYIKSELWKRLEVTMVTASLHNRHIDSFFPVSKMQRHDGDFNPLKITLLHAETAPFIRSVHN